ncbi:MAG: M28 family peptidase [Bacillota bacterium]
MKIFKSKILIASLLSICLVFACVGSVAVLAEDEYGTMMISLEEEYGTMLISAYDDATIGEKIVETALYLEQLHPYRGSGTDEEIAAAETLAVMLEAYGFDYIYDNYIDTFLYTPLTDTSETTTVTSQRKTSQNVVGYINNNQEQTIVIGAHYDNYTYDKTSENTGFYDNLLGVSAALEIAYQLANTDGLEYNVMVAFWGAEEDGIHGSEYFVSSLTSDALSKIALYVNLDTLAIGDNLYIFTNETSDYHEEIFLEESENLGYDLNPAPEDKQYTFAMLEERPFMHLGIQSDNYYFTTNEVMCANFISYVWEDGFLGESKTNASILYTENDNSEYIFSVHSQEVIEEKMTEVSEIILATLSRGDIIDVLQESKETSSVIEVLYDDSASTIATIAVLALFSILLFVTLSKLGKEIKLPENQEERSAPASIESVELFGETVVLEDGALKKKPTSDWDVMGNQSDDTPKNPFDF